MSPSKAEGGPRISLVTATAIVVANMVGVGVFTSLGFQVQAIPSGFPILLLWLVGGLVALTGACCYAEIAGMMPRSGGEYHYLSEIYHPLVGFLSGWVSVTVGFAAPTAAAGLAFGQYFATATGWGGATAWALVLVTGVTGIHLAGIRIAERFQIAFTGLKLTTILVLIVSALFVREPQGVTLWPQPDDAIYVFSGSFALSLFFVMYAYSGWNAAAYVGSEVRSPQRNLPLALLLGTGLVTGLYLALNACFLRVAPVEAMSGEVEVGAVAARYVFGENGGRIMGLIIAAGLVSTISSMTWAGPRVGQVMGEDYRGFRWLAGRSASGAPRVAILLQWVVVMLLLLFVPFEQIIYYIQAILTLSSLLVVAGLFYLRVQRPEADRPFRAWGYPVTPGLFLGVSLWMLVEFVQQKPAETAWGLVTLVVGGAVYFGLGKPSKAIAPPKDDRFCE